MDIYEYAESINWEADYYDFNTGYIYCIQEAGKMRKLFGIESDIRVVNSDGILIGYAKKKGAA